MDVTIKAFSNPSIQPSASNIHYHENLIIGPFRNNGVRTDVYPNNSTKPTGPAVRSDAPFWSVDNMKLDGTRAKHNSDVGEKALKNESVTPFSGLVPKSVVRNHY